MIKKQLHKHAVPVIILMVGLFIVSTVALNNLVLGGVPSSDTVGHLLTDRVLKITPSSNGLFHVSRYQPNDVADSRRSVVPNESAISGLDNAGKVAELEISLSSITETNH